MDEYGQLIDAHTVRFERLLPGPIERIWDYLADGSKRGEWFASGDLPAKPGEKFELRFKHQNLSPKPSVPPEKFIEMDKTGHTGKSTLLSFEPPRRLAYTFAEGPDGATVTRCASLSPIPRFPTAPMRWMCPAAGMRIWRSWWKRPMAAIPTVSGMSGAAMMAFTTSGTRKRWRARSIRS